MFRKSGSQEVRKSGSQEVRKSGSQERHNVARPLACAHSSKARVNRIVSYILIMSILITLLTPMQITHAATPLSDLPVGARIMFGGRQFAVMNPSDGTVVSLKSIAQKQFYTSNIALYNPSDSNNVGYYLNNTYYNTFTAEEKALIKNSTWYTGNATNETATSVTNIKIGLLRKTEYASANAAGIFPSAGEYAMWWLITPYSGDRMYNVDRTGGISQNYPNELYGVRPAFRILESTNFEYDTYSGMYYYSGTLGANQAISTLNTGNTIMFHGEAWRVVTPSTGLLVADRIIERRAFDPNNTKVYNPSDSNNVGYYLNNTYYDTYTAEEKALIKNSTWYTGDNGNLNTNETLSSVSTFIGLLRETEYNSAKAAGIFLNAGEYVFSWLITPYTGNSTDVRNVHDDGNVYFDNATNIFGIRPALRILESTIVNEVQTGVYAIVPPDTTSPSLTITSSPESPTTATTVTYTFQFSEAVTGFTASDISVTNGTRNDGTFTAVDGDTYTITVTKVADGNQVATVAANTCQDAAANLNTEGTITVLMTALVTSPGYSLGTVAVDRKWFKYYLGKDANGITKAMLVAPKDGTGVMQGTFIRTDILDPDTHKFISGQIYFINREGKIEFYN
ncbi:MAG TPA: hypothetical protein DCP90_02745 [Clostridiales bacterium]|nr:MAG: hypothetical protein A2Y22_01505 [Clostridiales bacterium GWD2_32_59]HAN09511.1 hypothetical protein [Clostridiales bacterium]